MYVFRFYRNLNKSYIFFFLKFHSLDYIRISNNFYSIIDLIKNWTENWTTYRFASISPQTRRMFSRRELKQTFAKTKIPSKERNRQSRELRNAAGFPAERQRRMGTEQISRRLIASTARVVPQCWCLETLLKHCASWKRATGLGYCLHRDKTRRSTFSMAEWTDETREKRKEPRREAFVF